MRLLRLLTLGLLLAPTAPSALVTYNGTNGVGAVIISAGGCAGCHGAASPVACTGTAVQTSWLDTTNASQARDSVSSCYSNINDKISASPSYGVRMPQGGPFFNSTELSLFSQWNSDGRLLQAAPTVTTQSAISVTNSSATLRSATAANGSTTTVNYRYALNAGLTSSPVTTASTNIGSGGGTGTSSANRGISSLLCGTTYYFRAQGSNGSGTTNGSVLNFTTSACSNPVITFTGVGSSAVDRISVSKNLTFTQADLTISASDADTGSLSWSAGTATSGSVVINNASTGAFTYTAPGTAGTATFTLTVTDTDPVGGGGPNTDTVTVYVTIADNAPQFKNSPGGAVITSDSLSVSEGDGVSPSQSINLFAEDNDVGDTITWSIAPGGAPTRGTLSAFNNPTGTTNSISYTPNNNVDVDDAFTIRVTDGTTNVDLPVTAFVTPVPDNPTAADDGPFIFDIGVPVVVSVLGNDGDVDTGDSVTVDPGGFAGVTAGASVSAVNSNTQVSYTSPAGFASPDTFQYRVVDTTARTSNLATVTMTPRDTDGDGIPNYVDNCPATSNSPQADNDNDSGGFINNNNMSDPAGNIGGDACDPDDDNDDMPDSYELSNSLDPFDPSDRNTDNDGDGVSNYDEFLAGTNPNLANLAIDATGYLTPFDVPRPEPASIHTQATSVVSSDPGPYRPGVNDITWTPVNSTSNDLAASDPGNLVSNPPIQPFIVRPLLSFAADQQVDEGSAVTVSVMLNGDAASYPVTVNYSISGTATAGVDYSTPMPLSGALQFNNSMPQTITFNTTGADGADPNETVVFTLTAATNAALGSKRTHRVTLNETNVAPIVDLQITQGGDAVVYDDPVAIDFQATVTDSSPVIYDWSGTDNALTPPPVGNNPNWTIAPPFIAGNYLVDVLVTDTGTPPRSTRVRRILKINPGPSPGGDLTDADNDGVPADFDNHDGSTNPTNLSLIADQTVNPATSRTIQTDPGNRITTGSTAKGANRYGPLVAQSDIVAFGSVTGGSPTSPNDSYRHVSGIIDFEVHGLIAGSSARVVIPLNAGIPRNAVYRKFHPATGWSDFVIGSGNALSSAFAEDGACPEPGSSAYRSGLNYLDNCLQVTIRDGGPNDTDNLTNGIVADPGAIGVQLSDPEIEEVEEGSGRISSPLLMLLAALGLLGAWRRRGRVLAIR